MCDDTRHWSEKDREYLHDLYAWRHAGPRTTTEIRLSTGLCNRCVNHRHDKFESKGWVLVDDSDKPTGDRRPPMEARLTDTGRSEIRKGAYGILGGDDEQDVIPRINREAAETMKNEMVRLGERVDALAEELSNVKSNLDT